VGACLKRKGKNSEAVKLLEKAVRLAPDYGLFRFKLAEVKLATGNKDASIAEEFKLALSNMDDPDGKMAKHAGDLLRNAGNSRAAKYFLDKAGKNAG